MVQGPGGASNAVQAGFTLIFLIRLCKDKGLSRAAVLKLRRWRSACLGLLLGLGMKGQAVYVLHGVHYSGVHFLSL